MDIIELNNGTVDLRISHDELLVVNNALNEVCNGLEQFEFESRMGATIDEVRSLLRQVGTFIDKFEEDNPG